MVNTIPAIPGRVSTAPIEASTPNRKNRLVNRAISAAKPAPRKNNIYTSTNTNAMTNDHIPDWMDSLPRDGPTISSAMIRAGAGSLPDFRMFARS